MGIMEFITLVCLPLCAFFFYIIKRHFIIISIQQEREREKCILPKVTCLVSLVRGMEGTEYLYLLPFIHQTNAKFFKKFKGN